MAKNDTRSERNTIGNENTHASNETLQHKSSANSEHNKSPGWYTAFYRYAEFLRNITSGAINHKNLYAYVGLNGRYVNNPNPRLRKRCAGGLSRLLHSSRYALDFQESVHREPHVFSNASRCLANELLQETTLDAAHLIQLLLCEGCRELRLGLVAEVSHGRSDVNFSRFDSECELLRIWAHQQEKLDTTTCIQTILCSFFYFMACGHLEECFANALVDQSPTDMLAPPAQTNETPSMRACVLRAVDNNPASLENMWALHQEREFCIGRYVDCDAVETNGLVSRRHCSIFQQENQWFVRDEHSRFGTAVHRAGQLVWSSTTTSERFPLVFGDCIVLAGQVRYWFMSLQNVERLLIIG